MIGLDFIGDDEPGAVFERSAERQAAAFRGPRARELAVHHPAFDMAGSQLLDFRVGDMLLHAWDLARATGADEALDPGLGAFVWASLEPLADALPREWSVRLGPEWGGESAVAAPSPAPRPLGSSALAPRRSGGPDRDSAAHGRWRAGGRSRIE